MSIETDLSNCGSVNDGSITLLRKISTRLKAVPALYTAIPVKETLICCYESDNSCTMDSEMNGTSEP
jgi:hypothetical protein